MKTRTASAIAFLALASLTSCSEADKRDVLDGPLPAPSRLALSIKLPFDKCEITLPEYYQISNAQDILTKSCMEKRGFDWPQVSRPKNAIDLRNRRRYGVIEEFVAREYGYHSGAKLANPCIVAQREEGRNQRLSKDARVAALNRESGCAFKSIEEMRSAPVGTVKMDRFYSLGNGAMERSQKSPRVISAMKKWSLCMRSIKAHYATPYEAISDKKWWKYGESGKPGARERAVAIRDVQCKDKSNLTRTWWKSESEIQDELIRENGEYFTRILRAKEEKLRYASRIINRS